MSFSDLSDHLAEAFAVNPSRREDAEHLARRAYLRRHASAQSNYRDTGRHALVCREWRARTPQSMRALCSRVWREMEEGRREDRRAAWIRREAVYHELRVMRGRTA